MQKLDTKTFIAEIVSETSLSPVPTKLGSHESTMDLYYSSAMIITIILSGIFPDLT
jgi:hypothetical protein